mgnify:CR=1 FL=1
MHYTLTPSQHHHRGQSYESWLYSLSDEDLRNMPARVQQDLIAWVAYYERETEWYLQQEYHFPEHIDK